MIEEELGDYYAARIKFDSSWARLFSGTEVTCNKEQMRIPIGRERDKIPPRRQMLK